MNTLVANLQYRVACLETQLTAERQRQIANESTVIYLSTLLAKQAQESISRVEKIESRCTELPQQKQRQEPVSVLPSGITQELIQFPTLEPTRLVHHSKDYSRKDADSAKLNGQPATKHILVSDVILDRPSCLLDPDLSLSQKATTRLRGEAAEFVPAGSASRQSQHIITIPYGNKTVGPAERSFNTITTESLSVDEAVSEPNIIADDKPPALDLQFRGLRTAHDGPAKASRRSFKSRESSHVPSFEEVFCLANTKSTNIEVRQTDVNADSVLKVVATGSKIGGTDVAALKTISDSVLNFSQSSSYRSSTPAQRSRGSNSNSTQSNDYFRRPLSVFHGIHYKPKENDLFLNRSRVMILNLALGTSIADVLPKIRGGIIVSCQLLNTKFAYNSLSAMVRFSSYVEAMRCVDHATTTPLVIAGKVASVQLIPTPSYPLAPEIYKNIFERGHTRCLRIYEFQQRVPARIRKEYTNPKYIEHEVGNGCGDWYVRFTSIERATALWGELEALRMPRSEENSFMPDICDGEEEATELKAWKDRDIQVMDVGVLQWKD